MSVDTTGRETADAAEAGARAFTETALFEGLARIGYLSRGVIYGLIGLLAIRLADGVAAPRPNQQGAMQQIAQQRYGHLLLLLTAIGLGGYALWRLAQALIGHTPEYGKHSALDRIGAAGSSVAYATFCVLAITVLRGTGGNSSAQRVTPPASGVICHKFPGPHQGPGPFPLIPGNAVPCPSAP